MIAQTFCLKFYGYMLLVLTALMAQSFADAILSKPSIPNQTHTEKKPITFTPIPYQATYKISLDKEKYYDIGISDINGTMETRVEQIAGVWKTSQKITFFIYYKEKENADKYEFTIDSNENADGKYYEFTNQFVSNDNHNQHIAKATFKQNENPTSQRYIQFTDPEYKRVSLPTETLFPMQLLHLIVSKACLGVDALPGQKLFDGSSDIHNVVGIDAEIQHQANYKTHASIVADMKNPTPADEAMAEKMAEQLQQAAVWKVKMNVFPPDDRDSPDPDYSYTQLVNSLGMIVGVTIKYLDPEFTINLTLTDCSPL